MYTHIHTFTYTYMHTYTHTHIHTDTHTHIHTYIHTHIHTYIIKTYTSDINHIKQYGTHQEHATSKQTNCHTGSVQDHIKQQHATALCPRQPEVGIWPAKRLTKSPYTDMSNTELLITQRCKTYFHTTR
jgi:hypothetical protein